MRRTIFGRELYAVGANATAARMMGLPVNQIVIAAYVLSATMAVLGGLLLTSYIGSPSLGIGDQFLLTSIAATVVGGTALSGGIGSVIETIGGLFSSRNSIPLQISSTSRRAYSLCCKAR